MKFMNIYSVTGPIHRWLFWAWAWAAALTSPALLCASAIEKRFENFCNAYEWIGILSTVFGPVVLMPLFLILIITQRLGAHFYPKDPILILATKICLVLAALLSMILFIVPINTLEVPTLLLNQISNPILKSIAEIILFSLWFAPAGMLYMLALFMIQFGFLRETLIQGYKPLLIYILAGGLTATTFGIFTTILGNYFISNPPPYLLPFVQKYSHLGFDAKLLYAAFNPFLSIVLDLIVPIPMLLLFKKCILDRTITNHHNESVVPVTN